MTWHVDGYQGRPLVADEGFGLAMFANQTATSCAAQCDDFPGCQSFTFGTCPSYANECLLKMGKVNASSAVTSVGWKQECFRTYYKLDQEPALVVPVVLASIACLIVSLVAVRCWLLKRRRVRGKEVFEADPGSQNQASDPGWAAISLEQLEDLRKVARQRFGTGYNEVNMHHVVAEVVRPLCAEHGKCYAHIVNGDELLHVTVFVSHCWAENFEQFCDSVLRTFCQWAVKPNIWICALALFQTTDPAEIAQQVGTGNDPRKAPFSRALQQAEKILVVRNDEVDLYSRIWCCWELFCAYEIGIIQRPGVLMVAGPTSASPPGGSGGKALVDINNADASNVQDKQMILRCVNSSGLDVKDINKTLTQIKHHDFAYHPLEHQV